MIDLPKIAATPQPFGWGAVAPVATWAPPKYLYKRAFLLGRFQPLHLGHIDMIEGALKVAENVLIIIGSADEGQSLKNPFTYEQRKQMIEDWFAEDIANGRIIIDGLADYTYRDGKWYSELGKTIVKNFPWSQAEVGSKPYFYTYDKDKSTKEYINGVRYDKVLHKAVWNIDATEIRNQFFTGPMIGVTGVPTSTFKRLVEFRATPEYEELAKEKKFIDEYKKSWEVAPFPPHFVAVDALCVWKDRWKRPHILVGVRKGPAGAGKLAIPGGYLEVEETLLESAKRELLEETSLEVDDRFILDKVYVFDAPNRSMRGRMITHVHHWNVYDYEAPEVKAGDDLTEAFWMPIDLIAKNKKLFFSDHYAIIAKILPMVENLPEAEGLLH